MERTYKELEQLLKDYGTDLKQALKEHKNLTYLYALCDLREAILEWYPFSTGSSILQVGADYGALTGLFAKKAESVLVIDEDRMALDFVKMRYHGVNHIRCEESKMVELLRREERFDYVTMIGTLEPPFNETIQVAKSLLNPGGVLLVAVCNRFGNKYLAGAKRDPYSFSLKEITTLMSEGKTGMLKFYYPMPDYKLPVTLYSDDYLPKKGELTSPVFAYDYPEFVSLDCGELFDMACEDGNFQNFANSYLIVWSDDEEY